MSDDRERPEHSEELEEDTIAGGPELAEAQLEQATSRRMIGQYRLLRRIGEGGMGEVWLADQQEPVRRRVALKIIKRGLDTKAVVARFEAERQALALMDHPNISRVIDAGETPGGRPYFAMEYVKGESITRYCDRHRLTIRERLDLLMMACEGVQHAHHKAVIHRDIKASNVLVAVIDGKPTVKIIDFGVAKAVEHRLTERTLFTELGMLIGTPEYMSPEQAEMGATDIDTRTDVYSLGVLLYELLTGTLPFASAELRVLGYGELCRRIREDDPPKPSTRVATLDQATTESAHRRMAEPRTLSRHLRGDLDWITMRALEKDRTRRYESSTALAEDLRRHLSNEAVLAGPPSAAYRASRFARRHRAGIAVAATAVLMVLAFVVAVVIQARHIAEERDRAEQASADLRSVVQFQAEMLSGVDAEGMGRRLVADLRAREAEARRARGASQRDVANTATLFERVNATDAALRVIDEEILVRAVDTLEERLDEKPTIDAHLRNTIGWTYLTLGMYNEAQQHIERSLQLRQKSLGNEHPDTLFSMNNLAVLHQNQGRYDEAEALHLETLEARKRTLGDEHPDTLSSMNYLAVLYQDEGRYEEAENLYLETLEARRRVLGDEHEDTLDTMNNLALVYRLQGRYADAEPLSLETLENRRRALGDEHRHTLDSLNNLALLYKSQNRFDEAEPLYLRSVEAFRRQLGDNHPSTLAAMNNLAVLYKSQGRYTDAERLYLGTLDANRGLHGAEHRSTLISMNNLAVLYYTQGRQDEAERLLRETVDITERALGEDHPDTLESMHNLAFLYLRQDRYADAEAMWRKALQGRRRVLGDDHPKTLQSMLNLALVYTKLGRYDAAEPLYVETLQRRQRVLGEDHPGTLRSMHGLASMLLGREPESSRDPRRALALAMDVNEASNFENRPWLETLSLAYCQTGDQQMAVTTQRKAIALAEGDRSALDQLGKTLVRYESGCP